MIETIDIDNIDNVDFPRYFYFDKDPIYFGSGTTSHKINRDAFIDWRGLERRYAEKIEHAKRLSNVYSSTLKSISTKMSEAGHSPDLVIFDQARSGPQLLLYDAGDNSTYTDYMENFVEKCKRDPNYKRSMVLGEDARALLHMKNIASRAYRVEALFSRAFEAAVVARLKKFIKERLTATYGKGYEYVRQSIIAVNNEGRTHLFDVDSHGQASLLMKRFFTTKEEK